MFASRTFFLQNAHSFKFLAQRSQKFFLKFKTFKYFKSKTWKQSQNKSNIYLISCADFALAINSDRTMYPYNIIVTEKVNVKLKSVEIQFSLPPKQTYSTTEQ